MKMWDGRFSKPSEVLMDVFNSSLSVDKTLVEEDITGSIAWARALAMAGIISTQDVELIIDGLRQIGEGCRRGDIKFSAADEDIHMAVERLLVEKIGEPGAKLHTGRSRNDQVVTDMRLYCKRVCNVICQLITQVQKTLLERAQQDSGVVIPGYTHLQQAQPVSLAHYWLSFFFLLQRDKQRFVQASETADIMPLGSGALAGCGFGIDRNALAQELGFSRISENSIDAVGSRDFTLELLAACVSVGINCSRYAEDLIIWSSKEFGFIELDDGWATGSSMMPQKKNPDSLELIRGKCGRFIGNYTRVAATLKGVGLTYYKDLQEDKEPLFDSVNQIQMVLAVFERVIATTTLHKDAIVKKLDTFLYATDIADYLVQKGVAFRHAHGIVGAIVKHCVAESIALDKLSIAQFKTFAKEFDTDITDIFNWSAALKHRDCEGGTGPASIQKQITKAKRILAE